jgi:hypothetical protein
MSPERTTLLLGLLRMHLDATDAELAEIGATRDDVLDLIRQHDAQPDEQAESVVRRKV